LDVLVARTKRRVSTVEKACLPLGAMPALTNALIDTHVVFSVRDIEMPATPERIWRAMQGR
jgi:hypothetical protein